MYKRVICVMMLLILSATTVYAHSAEIQISGGNKYKSIRLTPEIYNKANSDLSDILIKNGNGEAVPYFFNSGFQKEYEGWEAYPMELINSYTKDNSFYFDYKLIAERESDAIATSMEFSANNTNFAKLIEIYGSYDNLHWEFVQNDKLYAIDDKLKLSIEFNEPQKYTYYRLKLSNNLEKITFEAVDLVYNVNTSEISYFVESLTPKFSIEETNKTTLIKIEGLKNLRLHSITIETDSMFKRIVKTPLTFGKELYNLSIKDESYTDTTLMLNWQVSQEDSYIVTIEDNDDKPISIDGINVRYYSDEVVFEGKANEQYTLDFGADATKTAPIYDIERYKDQILKSAIDQAVIGVVDYEKEKEQEQPVEKDYSVIFNIVVVIIAVLLGVLILFSLKRKPKLK